jgi:hypothetical protein
MQYLLTSKYRGTSKYNEVRRELTYRARNRELMTYEEVATLIGIPVAQGSLMSTETGAVCGEISEDEVDAGRPMLSALAVGVSGIPGEGFFKFARRLGRFPANLTERQFWERERDAVYAAWRQPTSPK